MHGEVARKLFLDLNADEILDEAYETSVFALVNHELRIKKNKFARCKALKEKQNIGHDAIRMITKSVTCYIKAPKGTVF